MSSKIDLSYRLDISELKALLPADPHPLTNSIIHEADALNIQLKMAVERRDSHVEQEVDDDHFGVEYKKAQLSAIRRHSLDNFKDLERLLDRGIYCPFCFVFRNCVHGLEDHVKYSRAK